MQNKQFIDLKSIHGCIRYFKVQWKYFFLVHYRLCLKKWAAVGKNREGPVEHFAALRLACHYWLHSFASSLCPGAVIRMNVFICSPSMLIRWPRNRSDFIFSASLSSSKRTVTQHYHYWSFFVCTNFNFFLCQSKTGLRNFSLQGFALIRAVRMVSPVCRWVGYERLAALQKGKSKWTQNG